MTVSVLVEGILKDELVDEFVQICKGAYSVTRAYDGCQSITLNLNVDNRNNFVMTEVWDSKEHYAKYGSSQKSIWLYRCTHNFLSLGVETQTKLFKLHEPNNHA